MKKEEFLRKIESMLGMECNTLIGNEVIDSIPLWDSLAILGYLALVSKEFKLVLSPPDIIGAKTINDLIILLGDRIT